jgi:hypothetical protein
MMISCRRVLSSSSSSRNLARSFTTLPRNVVIVSGIRLPFATTASGLYKDELAVDLQRLAFQGLFAETALPKDQVDYVITGNVIQEVRTSNLAREAAINAGLPVHVGAHTIAQVKSRVPTDFRQCVYYDRGKRCWRVVSCGDDWICFVTPRAC